MDDEARRTILARRARFVATALSGLMVSGTAVAQTRGESEPPLPPHPPLAGDEARFGLGVEAIATTNGAESAGGEGGGIAYVGWGNKLHFRALVLARVGGTDEGVVLPLGAGLTTRLFYARQPGLELGLGLSLSGGYLIAAGSPRALDSGPFVDARFEPTVFRLDNDLGAFGVFFGVRFARRTDESPAFAPLTATIGAVYSFAVSGPRPLPLKQARKSPPLPL